MASFKPFYTEDQSFRQTDLVIKSMEKIPALSNTELTDRKTHSEREENQRMTAGVQMIRSFTDSLQPFVAPTKKTETIPSVNGSYLTYYRKIAESIREGAALPVTAEEGINVIRIIEAAMKSSKEKRTIMLEH